LTLDAFALDGLSDGPPHRIRTSADGDLIERYGHLRTPVRPRGRLHAADDPAHDRAGRDQHLVAAEQVGNGRRFEAVLHLGRRGAELRLEADVQLLAGWNRTAARLRAGL